jgi:hypothetical protein
LIRRLREREGLPLIFYVHPWEYDPAQPRIRLRRLVPEITHYMFLSTTAPRTARLLRDFRFTTMERAFADAIGAG